VYHWLSPAGATLAWYCNVSDRTVLCPAAVPPAPGVRWRDLVVDVLFTPGGRREVLDREELPLGLEVALQEYIQDATGRLLSDGPVLTQEVAAASAQWWPRILRHWQAGG